MSILSGSILALAVMIATLVGEQDQEGAYKLCLYRHSGSLYGVYVEDYKVCPPTIDLEDYIE